MCLLFLCEVKSEIGSPYTQRQQNNAGMGSYLFRIIEDFAFERLCFIACFRNCEYMGLPGNSGS